MVKIKLFLAYKFTNRQYIFYVYCIIPYTVIPNIVPSNIVTPNIPIYSNLTIKVALEQKAKELF